MTATEVINRSDCLDFSYDVRPSFPKENGKLIGRDVSCTFDNPTRIVNDDLVTRLYKILHKILYGRCQINDFAFNMVELVTDTEVQKRVLKEIVQLIHELFQNIIDGIKTKYNSFINHPTIVAIDQFREDYITLKVINLVVKLANTATKPFSEPTSKAIKHSGTIFKITKKILNFRDLDFRKISYKHLLDPQVLHEIFKALFYTLKIPVSIIEFANNNPYLLMAYEAAGLGETYKPFTGLLVEWCETIAPYLTAFKLVNETYAVGLAVHEFRQIKQGDQEYNRKLLMVIKTVSTLALDVLKIGVKLSVIGTTGVLGVSITAVIIPVGSCSVCLLGLWLVYKGVQQSHAEEFNIPDLKAKQQADTILVPDHNNQPVPI